MTSSKFRPADLDFLSWSWIPRYPLLLLLFAHILPSDKPSSSDLFEQLSFIAGQSSASRCREPVATTNYTPTSASGRVANEGKYLLPCCEVKSPFVVHCFGVVDGILIYYSCSPFLFRSSPYLRTINIARFLQCENKKEALEKYNMKIQLGRIPVSYQVSCTALQCRLQQHRSQGEASHSVLLVESVAPFCCAMIM